MKKLLLLSAIFGSVTILSSCGGQSSVSDTGNSTPTGTLKLAVKFPSQDGVSAQFLDPNISCIVVEVFKHDPATQNYFYKEAIITPDNPVAVISGLPVGDLNLEVHAYDGQYDPNFNWCWGNLVDYVYAYTKVAEGVNTFTINLLRAKWVFVDSQGNPSPINLNATLSSSDESIEGFYVLPYRSFSTSALDPNQPVSGTTYTVVFYGQNLNDCYSADPALCITEGIYYLQLIGPNTSNNAFKTRINPSLGKGVLQPDTNGNLRLFQILGTPVCANYKEYGYSSVVSFSCSISDPTADNYSIAEVISSDTMQGYIHEILVRSFSETQTCYTDPNNPAGSTITCPSYINAMSSAINKAVKMALAEKELVAQQTCINNVSLSQEVVWEVNTSYYSGPADTSDIDGDGDTYEFLCDNNFDGVYDLNDDTNGNGNIECWPQSAGGDGVDFYVKENVNGTFDVCFHPFTAKAQAIPSGELNLIIQKE